MYLFFIHSLYHLLSLAKFGTRSDGAPGEIWTRLWLSVSQGGAYMV